MDQNEVREFRNKLNDLERLLREDLSLDRRQKDELPDGNQRLDMMYSKLEEIKNDFNLIREEMRKFREQFEWLLQKLQSEER
ncbi:hypothetical protein JW766_01835 [Candidatus Dojkabacteria bacterium]|nr:hypothetical protein [Candidatus Dojkabacteria bacterium]